MRPTARNPRGWTGALVFSLLLCGTAGCVRRPATETPVPRNVPSRAESGAAGEAVRLYDEGRYDQARVLLEQLDSAGALTGPLLYRLGFCLGQSGDASRQTAVMQRALVELQKQAASDDNLEVSFFLANALNNLDRAAEARKGAAEATLRVEKGAWPKPARPIDEFRLAKLYQDQGRNADAIPRYRAALSGWKAENAATPGYQKWARRFLGQDALGRGDFRQAEADFAALTLLGGASSAEFDRLAVCRVKLSDWPGAAQAWREAERLDPANSDRPRYCRNLALLADSAGALPATSPQGKAWSTLTSEELETVMADQAKALRDARAEAVAGLAPARKVALAESVANSKRLFVAAGLEYAGRYLDIRQTAFTGGYAPLIFHPEEWTVEAPQ